MPQSNLKFSNLAFSFNSYPVSAPRFHLLHEMRYIYDRPVRLSPQRLHLRPAAPIDRVLDYQLRISPTPQQLYALEDVYGNPESRAIFTEPVEELLVQVTLTAELRPRNPFAFLVEPYAATLPFAYPPELASLLQPYCLFRDPLFPQPPWAAWGGEGPPPLSQVGTPPKTVDFLVALNQQLAQSVIYEVRTEAGVQPGAVTLERGRGSCRDTAWVLVEQLRRYGLAARFVSGYLIQHEEAASVELHAWAEAYLPGAGWVGFDTTSGLLTAEGHLRLAAAPEPEATMPLIGGSEAAEVQLEYGIAIERLAD